MGVELAKTSVEKILEPQPVEFSPLVAVILAVSIAVKLYMSHYNRAIGRKIGSAAMAATAADSLSDSLATTAVLLSTLAGHFWNVNIDGWCGAAVACFILWAGVKAAKETIDPLLGQPPSPEFVSQIQEIVLRHREITGIHDLMVHDYGPGRLYVSLHAEVPASGDILALHDVVDSAERELASELGCLATIHMDPVVSDDGLTAETRERVAAIVRLIDPGITIHDFRMVPGPTHTNVIFDAVVPYGCPLSDQEVARRVQEGVRALDGNYFARGGSGKELRLSLTGKALRYAESERAHARSLFAYPFSTVSPPGRKISAARRENSTAAAMAAGGGGEAPVRTPSHPCSPTALATPLARLEPKPVRGTLAPAPPHWAM